MDVAVLLSGGVDSSTALMRLKARGHRVVAFYLKIWLEDDTSYLGSCPWEEDLEFARAVCAQAGVELRVVPLQLEYYDKVVEYALAELKAGRTPSPDIFCNQRIKFGAFFDRMAGASTVQRADGRPVDDGAGAPSGGGEGDPFGPGAGFKVATGHYARIDWLPGEAIPGRAPGAMSGVLDPEDPRAGTGPGRWRLLRAPDPVKDQTYFLSHLSQAQLGRILFPIGAAVKDEVRAEARALELANRDRPDSQGICFLGKIRYPDFVRHYLGESDGPIIERESGRELGRHKGFWFHTIGQRAGLGLGNGPWYVSAKDCRRNVVYVSHGERPEEAERLGFRVGGINWLFGSEPAAEDFARWNLAAADGPDGLCLKLRHGPQLIPCRLEADGPGACRVDMARPDRGVAPGQFAVFYRGEECLGSGMILEDEAGGEDRLWARHLEWLDRAAAELSAAKQAKAERRRERRAARLAEREGN